MAARITEWRRLPVSRTELCIATTLRCGQSFRWKHDSITDCYACTLRGRIVQLKQNAQGLEYRSIWPNAATATATAVSANNNPGPRSRPKSSARVNGTAKSVVTKIKDTLSSGTRTKRKRGGATSEPLTPPSSTTPSTYEAEVEVETKIKGEFEAETNVEADHVDEDGQVKLEDGHDDTLALITHYLNLEPNLSDLYSQWSKSDANFKKKAPRFTGVRILRQDSWEALVCFICSSNNNIARIGQMVDKLCAEYGAYIGMVDEQPQEGETEEGSRSFFDFPGPDRLIGKDVEGRLRELGFGYRARYIAETARLVHERGGKTWLDTLRNPDAPAYGSTRDDDQKQEMKPEGRDGYRAAHETLLELQGVGPKVADCVCLMGLGWGEAVPVDTHVWQIAQRDYKFGKGKHSSLTKATYDAVANHFRKLWGQEAGWAHSVLFTADLRVFAERLATKIEENVEVKTKVDDDSKGEETVKQEVRRVAVKVKREVDETTTDLRPKIEVKIEEDVATTTTTTSAARETSTTTGGSSERVKRRKR